MDFDHALKELFQSLGTTLFERLGGAPPREWLNVELPQTRAARVDLVTWLMNGTLFHLEFQSSNHRLMPWRMLDYYSLLFQQYDVEPVQVVLYLGDEHLRMATRIGHKNLQFSYAVVDIRDRDFDESLSSSMVGDHVLAVLSDSPEPRQRVRRILERLLPLEPELRNRAVRLLLVISGLRKDLSAQTVEEIHRMNVVIDPMKNEYLRGLYEEGRSEGRIEGRNEGRSEGRIEGRSEGRNQGRSEGRASQLREILEVRFGIIPDWIEQKLRSASEPDLKKWGIRLLKVERIEEIFD